MTTQQLPSNAQQWLDVEWREVEPLYSRLESVELTQSSLDRWMREWAALQQCLSEISTRLSIAKDRDTHDECALRRYLRFEEAIATIAEERDERLRQKLVASGLVPENFTEPLKRINAAIEIFSVDNLELQVREAELCARADRVTGSQTVMYRGKEVTLVELTEELLSPDRAVREESWRLSAERALRDRQELNAVWRDLLGLRQRVAANARCLSYRDYCWKERGRFDYTPSDAKTFCGAIEEVIVPLATAIYERRAQELGVPALRPWDLVDGWYANPVPLPGHKPLPGAQDTGHLVELTQGIFRQLDPEFGDQFALMVKEQLLDLDNKKGKAPGAYCADLPVMKRPFIMMNSTGVHDDIVTLLHECGHAFHCFATRALPYQEQHSPPMEFAEVASMATEHLGMAFISASCGGPYSEEQAREAERVLTEEAILFWPFMAVVDLFQHWVYENPGDALHGERCDATWDELWQRFLPGVDWSGLEDTRMTGWQRKHHIFDAPFYYIEYGLARMGAMQVWRNYQRDPHRALRDFKAGLALGGTARLPELFSAVGAEFGMTAELLRRIVG